MTRSMHPQFNLSSDSADVMRASKFRASLIFARCDTDVRVEEDELRMVVRRRFTGLAVGRDRPVIWRAR